MPNLKLLRSANPGCQARRIVGGALASGAALLEHGHSEVANAYQQPIDVCGLAYGTWADITSINPKPLFVRVLRQDRQSVWPFHT